MNTSLFSKEKIDFTKEPMFFGTGKNLQRYDIVKYKFFETMYEKQSGFFWRPQEINLIKDKGDFNKLSESEKHIFISNLKFQILLDSLQGRGPAATFVQLTTLPEYEACLTKMGDFEILHSKSYSHVIRNVFTDPSEVFDTILDNEYILRRAETITQTYNDLYYKVNDFLCRSYRNEDLSPEYMKDLKKTLYLAIINWNILEGIRFYNSFACSFAFAENQLMEGNAKEIKLIARDEATHLAISQYTINTLKKNHSEGFQEVIAECEEEVYAMYKTASEEESEWADYLFKDGSIIGLNAVLLKTYNKHLTNKRLQAIGYKAIFEHTENPLTWMDNWLNSSNVEVAPQETELTSYVIGGLDSNTSDDDWNVF